MSVAYIIIIILYCTIKKGFILPLNIPLIKKKCQNLICPVPPPLVCFFFTQQENLSNWHGFYELMELMH